MEYLRDTRPELKVLFGTAIAGLALSACSGSGDPVPESDQPVGQSQRPNLTCNSAGLFTDYGTDERYLKVNVTNGANRQVEVDHAHVRELETQREHDYQLTDNKTPITISSRAVQVTVSVGVDEYQFSCPTIYYPNRKR